MNGQNREDIKIGAKVEVVLKEDQGNGTLTSGIVVEILTNSSFHPHGIKVRLEDGQVGRVQNILSPANQSFSNPRACPPLDGIGECKLINNK